jgi:hypothetical protein
MGRPGFLAKWCDCRTHCRMVPKRARWSYCDRLSGCLLRLELAGARDISQRPVFHSCCGPRRFVPTGVALLAAASATPECLIARRLILLGCFKVAGGFPRAACGQLFLAGGYFEETPPSDATNLPRRISPNPTKNFTLIAHFQGSQICYNPSDPRGSFRLHGD